MDPKSEDDAVCCSIFQNRMHMECFLKGPTLETETTSCVTRKQSMTSLASETIKAALTSQHVLILCDKCKTSEESDQENV